MIVSDVGHNVKPKNSLGNRLLLMISIPVMMQLILTMGIWHLRNAAEDRAIDCGIAREAAAAVRVITSRALTLTVFVDTSLKKGLVTDYDAQKEFSQLNVWTHWFCTTKGTEELGKTASEVSDLSLQMVTLVKHACQMNRGLLNKGEPKKFTPEDLQPKVKELEEKIEKDLFALQSQQVSFATQKSMAPSSKMHDWLFYGAVGGILINLGTLTWFGLYFSKDILARLAQVQENVLRIQRRGKLLPRVKGKDEITQLDGSFHEMASVLDLVEGKERTLFEHAYNVLCSVDKSRRFVEINQASLKVLGYGQEELVGRPVESFVPETEKEHAIKCFRPSAPRESQATFELTMTRKDGALLDTLWTTSATENTDQMFCVVHNISERKAAQRLRKEMVQMVTYDLRSPLTSLGVVYSLLKDNKLGVLNSQGHKLLTAAQANSERMLRLINDLLDIEKLEAGMVKLEKVQTRLSMLLEQSLDSVLPLANQKQIQLFNSASGNPFTANVDPHRIVQVLINLLSNAIKFSPPGGIVTLDLLVSEHSFDITVVDQGRGIPEHLWNEVFNRFQQVQRGDATEKGGSGLGLAICKSLIELHDGVISVRSEPGQGSIFTIKIPRA